MKNKTRLLLFITFAFFQAKAQLNFSREIMTVTASPFPIAFNAALFIPHENSFLTVTPHYLGDVDGHYIMLTKTGFNLTHQWTRGISYPVPADAYKRLHHLNYGKLSNGHYFVFGTSRDTLPHGTDSFGVVHPPERSNFFLVVMDSLGNLQWSKNYRDTVHESPNVWSGAHIAVNNGGIDILASYENFVTWVRLDNNGNILTQMGFTLPYDYSGGISVRDGTTVLMQHGPGGTNLISLNSAGTVNWAKKFGLPSWMSCVYQLPGGDILVGGSGYWLAKINAAGNFLWAKSYYNSTELMLNNSFIHDIITDHDGNILTFSDTAIFKLKPNGNLIKTVKKHEDDVINFSCLPDRDTFNFVYRNDNENNVLAMFDNGLVNDCLKENHHFAVNDSIFSVTSSNIASSLVPGSFYVLPFPVTLDIVPMQYLVNPWCSEFDLTGISENGTNPALSVYPNPVTDVLNIGTGATGPMEISIYDMAGKKVIHLSIQGKVDVSQLESGVYVVQAKGMLPVRFVKE